MATVTVNISATDNMSPVIASLQQQLNQLQQQANVLVGGRMGQAANQMANYSARLFESMLNSMGTKLWKSFTNNLKSAYNEIKAIDDELVVVRRITGKTNEELTGMTKNAMSVAQAYGIAASKYLSGVADFTRAGYQGQAESLAELSVKLQRAGDVSADVANQYILAIDKAYGLQGNIEALTAAMDGANQIGNEYATNVGEIAAGIGKVATIASTAHVGINELTAALGTITAVTQRSGTEAATALRAIFLNIMGDTSTEIEEGAKWTAGEIEGLRQVLELYAPEVVRAAEATGTLIDPMEAIGALAKSYQDGVLTEAKLFSMVSDIGGKLRTNQLMVLIKNWDMYESMLNTYANASGSIDREVANSLDSITVKTERLKASWVALVNETVSTGMIKGVLDGLNTAVQSIGNLGNALTIVLGLVTALKAQRFATLFAGVGANAGQIANLTASFRGFGLAITAIGVALSAANGIIKAHNDSLEKNVQAAIESGTKAGQSSQEIMKLYTSYITAKAGTEEYTTALHALAEALGMTAQEAINAGNSIDNLVLKKLQQAVADAKTAVQVYDKTKGDTWFPKTYTVNFSEYSKELTDIVDKYKELFEMTDSNVAIFDTTTTLDQLITQYRAAEQMQEELRLFASQNGINLANFQPYLEVSKYLQEVNKQYQEAVTLMEAYSTAEANLLIKTSMPEYQAMADLMKQIAEGGEASETTLREYAQIWDDLISSIQDSDFDGYGKWVKESLIGILDKQFPQIAKFSKQWAEIMNPSENKMADQVAEQAESVNKLTVALSNATKAKNAFDEAMKRDAENAGFKNYQDAYTAYAQEIKAGRVNSQVAMAAAEYLMAGGAVDFETLYREKGYKGVNAYMQKGFFETLYGNTEKAYGEGLLDVLSKLANKNGEIVNSNGEVVATYKKVGKEVSFTIDDLKGLSEVMGGVSIAQVWDSIKALGVYGDIQNQVDSFTNALEAMGEAGEFLLDNGDSNKLLVDYGALLNYAKEIGMTSDQWMGMKQWLYMLNELGEIEMHEVPDYEEGWQNYDDMVDGIVDKTEQAAESAQEAKENLEEAAETVADTKPAMPEGQGGGGEGGGTDNKAQALLDEYNRVLAELDTLVASQDYEIKFTADGTPAITTIQTIENDANIASRERTITFDPQTGGVVQIIDVLKDHADKVAETRTITYKADGTIDNIAITRQNAQDPTVTDQFVIYYTNGDIANISYTKTKAGEPLGPHLVAYYANGEIDHLEWVDETAKGIEEHEFKVNYGTDGSINGLTETYNTAEGVQHKEYQFQFGADGKLLETKVSSYMEYADGTTSVPFEYTLSANDGPAFDEVAEILTFIQGNYTDKSSAYTLDANNDPAENVLLQTVEEIAASTGGNYGKYTLDADNKSALAAIKEVEDKINQLLPDHRLEYSKGNTLTDALYNATLEALHSSDLLSEAQRSYYTSAQHTVEYYYDENGKPVEKSTQIDDKGNGTVTYTYYTDDDLQTVAQQEVYDVADGVVVPGSVKFDKVTDEEIADQTGIEDVEVNGGTWFPDTASFEVEPDPIETPDQEKPTIEVAMEVTPDKASAEEAAKEAQKIASLTLGANPVPFIPEEGYDGEYAGQWDGNDIYTVSFEIENEGVFDDIMYIDKQSGKPHVISIQTAGDGAQTISETVYTLDGAVESQNVITVDASGNAETNLQSLEALVEFLNRTFNITVQTNTGNSTSQLNRIKDLLDSIKSKTVTVTTKQVNVKDPKSQDKVATAATGAVNFNSGYALINEKGPELVAADGMASIYANGFPTIAKIPKGATIYTAEQTAKMLGGKMSLPAYADGTVDPAIAEFIASLPTGPIIGTITEPPPKKKEEEEEEPKKEEEPRGGGQSSKEEEEENEEFWDTIRKYIEYGLKKIMYQIEGYQDDIEAIEKARDKLLHPIEEELEDLTYTLTLLEYEVTLLERARDDAVKPLDKEIERLEKARDISREEYDLEEKRQALEDARNQRTIRQFNEETGQWEWVADQKAIADAEKAYNDAMADYEISQLKRERDAIYDSYQDEIDALEEQEEVIKRRQEDLEIEKTKIEYEYNEMIEPLQEKVDELQDIYDDLEKYYNRLVDAVEVPTEDLTEALEQMRQAEERYANQVEETVKLLNTLYDLAPTWSPVRVEDTITQYRPGYDPINGTTTTTTNVYINGVNIDGPEATTLTHIFKKHRMYHGG